MAVNETRAILLATGESTVLSPLTGTIPTPMIPVVNRPVMAYMVELLARQGFKEIVVSLFHLAGQIEAYFGDGRRWGVSLQYALQSQALGTAGALKWAQQLLPGTFIVLPADRLLDVDIADALARHRSQQSAATIIRSQAMSVPSQGDLLNGTAVAPGATESEHTGAYIFENRVLGFIPPRKPYDIRDQLLPAVAAAQLSISHYEMGGYVNPMRTFDDHYEAQRMLLTNHNPVNGSESETNERPFLRYFAMTGGRRAGDGVWVGRNHTIHPLARLTAPVVIGDNSYVGRGVELGPFAVIGSNVVLGDEATVTRSTILDGTYVGTLVNIEHRLVSKNLVIDVASSDSMRISDDFLLGQTHQTIGDSGLQRVLEILIALPLLLLAAIISLPLSLALLLTTGRIFRPVGRQYYRPELVGERQVRTFDLLRFNAQDRRGVYNWLTRWMVRLEFHRWPELWNLVKGDLALVGVKPLSPDEIGRLNEPWHQPRHEQRPGLTGLWYINTPSDSDLDESVVADIYYLATRSWREDLRILWQTPFSWYRRVRR